MSPCPVRKAAAVRRRLISLLLIWLSAASLLPGPLRAGDWPQILGPDRNGLAVDERLPATWPKDGPRVVWQRSVGHGYAGVAVAQGRAILFHRLGGQAVAEALDARTGKRLWKQAFPTAYQSSIAPDDGPRCVPLIHKQQIYLFGADGDLHALGLDTGEVVWSRDAAQEYKAPLGYFGAGSTPLVEHDTLLVNLGAPGAGIVAFAMRDGKTVWQATDEAASYSSPVAATWDGQRHAIFVTRLNVVSLDPANGAERFRFPFGMRGPTVNAATPLMLGHDLFLSASYGVGARLVHVAGGKPETVWSSDDMMSSQYTTCVEHQGTLYGIHGRQDQGLARLRAFDPRTQKVHWTQDGFGTGNLILADGKLLIMKTDGELILAQASTEAFRPLARAQVLTDAVQPLPALAGGLLYVRDAQTLKCLQVGSEPDRAQ